MSEVETAKIIQGLLGPVAGIVVLILVLTVSLLGIFLRRYLEQKAQFLATREDFHQLQDQLKESTRLVESIKAEVQHNDWARREWFAIRSKKLEELTVSLNAVMVKVHAAPISVFIEDIDSSSLEIDTLHAQALLYFPELSQRIKLFLDEVVRFFVYLQVKRTADQLTDGLVKESTHKQLVDEHRQIQQACADLLRKSALDAGLLK